jgi:hypothetical protein
VAALQTPCCKPPHFASAAARFQQGATVNVYIDENSGFTPTERDMITEGLENWNNQPNNSGVQFNVTSTSSPPAPGGNNTVIVTYQDVFNNAAVAGTSMHTSSGPSGVSVYGTMTFFQNIRHGWEPALPAFVRTLGRHEGGHTIGLDNANDCPPGSTIMNFSSSSTETFITDCDNAAINEDPAYWPANCPCLSFDEGQCPDTCFGAVDICAYPQSNGCPTWPQGIMNNGCDCFKPSPILVDVNGDGFALTDAENGVGFDIDGNGARDRLSWTAVSSNDAWLVLDRNGNGLIDDGRELFGTFTPQSAPPTGEEKNGFRALAEYDKPQSGGNGDGRITRTDGIFLSLRLWQDTNHNGLSESSELHSLPELGLTAIHLDYKRSKRVDRYGNEFRYRARVMDIHNAQLGRWAWDVFLMGAQP